MALYLEHLDNLQLDLHKSWNHQIRDANLNDVDVVILSELCFSGYTFKDLKVGMDRTLIQ